MLDDHAGRAVELDREQASGGEIVEVVERERLAVELLDAREQVGAGTALGVEDRPLMRILAVRELLREIEHRHERLREAEPTGEPPRDGAVVRRRAGEGAHCERAPRLDADLAEPQLREHQLVVLGPADGDHVGVVLRGATEQGRTADVDLLDRLVPLDVEPADGLLEGIEIDADEVDRVDAVRGEVGDVLGHVAARENAAVHCRVQRHDTVAEHLGEARQLLEPDHRDPLLGEQRRGAAARDDLEVEPDELRRERRDARLVEHREQSTPHAAVNSLTTSGSRRCSAAWTRARSESGVSPSSTGTRSAAITAPVSIPSST